MSDRVRPPAASSVIVRATLSPAGIDDRFLRAERPRDRGTGERCSPEHRQAASAGSSSPSPDGGHWVLFGSVGLVPTGGVTVGPAYSSPAQPGRSRPSSKAPPQRPREAPVDLGDDVPAAAGADHGGAVRRDQLRVVAVIFLAPTREGWILYYWVIPALIAVGLLIFARGEPSDQTPVHSPEVDADVQRGIQALEDEVDRSDWNPPRKICGRGRETTDVRLGGRRGRSAPSSSARRSTSCRQNSHCP